MIPRHVETIFCDDIRQEVNNKITLIGTYSDSLLVNQFPVNLPKLCLAMNIVSPANDPFRKLTIRILKDDDVLQELPFSEEELIEASPDEKKFPEEEIDSHYITFRLHLMFSPMKFEEPCMLRVRVETEREELLGLGLKVDVLPKS